MHAMPRPTPQREIYSVSALNREVAGLLEQHFAWVWVEGEISNLARPASGHLYFSLKDDGAQIRCAMFRSRNRELDFEPEHGLQVVARGKISLYQPRGDYQLIVDRMEPAGAGALQKRFEALKNRLAAEGLFAAEHKRPVPELPRGIAVITSPSGAAVRDVLSVIGRRFPSIPVRLYATPVQGDEAAPAIARALQGADSDPQCDVILLVRGGGSLEDLWAFNEEAVARAIFDCATPVVSGVGHETDVTIADFVADLRAATPSAAAEAVTPDQQSWQQTLDWFDQRLQQLIHKDLHQRQQQLGWLGARLQQQHPLARLNRSRAHLQQLSARLQAACQHALLGKTAHWQRLHGRLLQQSPMRRIGHTRHRLQLLWQRLHHAVQQAQQQRQAQLSQQAGKLQALSPLQTLARGYSITTDAKGHAIIDATALKPGQQVHTRLHYGGFSSQVLVTDGPGKND